MRYLALNSIISLFLTVAFIQISFSQPPAGYTLTDNQIRFAESLSSEVPSVIYAKWQSPTDLWVEADGVNQSKAKEIALDVIFEGKNILDQTFCVHVHNGDWKQIAMTCWSAP